MPFVHVSTSAELDDAKAAAVAARLSPLLARLLGKPEAYVMVAVDRAAMRMAASADPAAFVDVRSIGGLGAKVNQGLAAAISTALGEELGLAADRIYLNFTDVPAASWGWDGATFG
jgi:phenylpyruvate tautomerase